MRLTLRYGARVTQYDVRENPGLTAKLRIHVEPSGALIVEAPAGASADEIRSGVQKRARWIMGHVDRFHDYRAHALPRDYRSGETHFYLGRRYKLQVIVDPSVRKRSVRMVGGRLAVVVATAEDSEVRRALKDWYRARATVYLSTRVDRIASQLDWVDVSPPIRLLSMKRYWGSCSPRGAIILNPALIKAPARCVDYVLLHELCHLAEHNHSPRFYGLLDRHMRDWRNVREELDQISEIILAE